MNIKYLNILQNYPAAYPNDIDYKDEISEISEEEIKQLKAKYNNGIDFQKALQELLLFGR